MHLPHDLSLWPELEFAPWPALVAHHARLRPQALAVVDGSTGQTLTWQQLDQQADAMALALQQRQRRPQQVLALIGGHSPSYVARFIGALRAGLAVTPLPPSATPEQLMAMLADSAAVEIYLDDDVAQALATLGPLASTATPGVRVAQMAEPLSAGPAPAPVDMDPQWAFNIIYSSGTTGTPKGIVQSHAMRWAHIRRAALSGYTPDAITLVSTPPYSNTTLVSLIPCLAWGGTAVLLRKFSTRAYLELAQQHRVTHSMLVPVQYQRLMDDVEFDRYDLSSFKAKFCTSAPFRPELKAEVLKRWPGGLTEYYGLTEGGGTLILLAHLHPNKLHTVGQPAPGHDLRLIDDHGQQLHWPAGSESPVGEVVGASPGMMSGYLNRPEQSAEMEWFDATGKRFLRSGDIGRFDADGFLILMDRRKDMLISGGFNVFPSDIEAVLLQHPAVADAAVFGLPSREWGETPVACVVLREGYAVSAIESVLHWTNGKVAKTQRLAEVRATSELPRSAIGKVLKKVLRESWS